MQNKYVCALDIGSSKLVAAVALHKKHHITGIYLETLPAKGVKDGAVVDSIELIACISRLLKNLKIKSGIKIKSLLVSISGQDILTKNARAIIPLAERGNKVITAADLHKVNEQARILGSSLEEEIIHQIPSGYSIDSASGLENPLGLYSHRLEVDLYLICAKIASLQNLSRIINQAGYEVKDIFLSGIATSRAVFSQELKNGVNILCDIGNDITEILLFKDGMLKGIQVLLTGGSTLTEKLAKELNIPFDLAEDLKKTYTSIGDYAHIPEDKEILVKRGSLYKPIKQKLAASIITIEAAVLCENIKSAVEKLTPLADVNYFVATGRTVLMEGFLESLENILGAPVKLGRIVHPEIASFVSKEEALSGHKYLTYLTALGMLCQGISGDEKPQPSPLIQPEHNSFRRLINRVKEVYQEYF